MAYQKLSFYQNGVLLTGSLTFDDSGQATVTVKYESSSASSTGVGYSVDFDSSQVSVVSVDNVLGGSVASGSLNSDGNGLNFGWADLFGNGWPGSTEADLATITFSNNGDSSVNTAPSITFVSSSAGYEQQVVNPVISIIDDASEDTSDNSSDIVVPELQAQTQHIYISESTMSEDGTQVTVKLSYLADDPTLTGVGFNLNFDSNVLSLDSVSGVASGSVASGSLNSDGDGLTFAWADPFGGSWPGSSEAELATVTFNIAEGATGSTALDIVKTSNAAGFSFDGQSHDVVITADVQPEPNPAPEPEPETTPESGGNCA